MNLTKLKKSFGYAWHGWQGVWRREQNFRIQLAIGIGVIIAGLVADLSHAHWLVVLGLVALIPAAEMVNSVVEELADRLKLPYSETTYLRDLSAGLVLWFCLAAVVIGLNIFYQYL